MAAAVDSALAAFLDLLLLADEPGFRWSPVELRAAFQWAATLQQLLQHATAAALVQERLQVRVPGAAAAGAALPGTGCPACKPRQCVVHTYR